MDEDGAHRRVLHPESGGFSVLHLEIVGRIIQAEALCGLDFHRVVRSVLQRQEGTSSFASRHGIHQSAIHAADLECSVGDTLPGVIRIDFDDLHPADGVVIKREGLRVLRVDHHRLALDGGVDGVALDGPGLPDYDGADNTRDADLAVGVGGV